MDVDLSSPRVWQAAAAGVVLLGFAVDFRVVVALAALGLLATFVRVEPTHRLTWAVEVGLLVVSALLFLVGRAGWAWVLGMLAAGTAAMAAAADVWIAPSLAGRFQVRRP
ncbi:MAG: hypothetical protein JO265_14985 [Acidimicrobiia bacterium]|nr:hypothetical protein [Acidimicrobiia bacterium]